MRRRPNRRMLLAVLVLGLAGIAGVFAVFSSSTSNAGNDFNAKADFKGPTIDASTIAATSSGNPTVVGSVKKAGTYKIYANATDSGAPASGVASVAADVSNVTNGATSVTLTFDATGVNVDGTTYHWVSAEQTADNKLSEGSKSYTVTGTDNDNNVGSPGNFSVLSDNTGPTIDATIANTSGGPPGSIKPSDTYKVYANLTDTAGVDSATANVTNVTTGQTSVTLTHDDTGVNVGGTTYHWVSTQLTANNATGSKNYSVSGADKLGNQSSQNFSVTLDATFPNVSAATIATTSSGDPVSGLDGTVAPNHTYRVYAEISDGAGVTSASADVSSIESTQTAVPLVFNSNGVTIGNKTYHWISAERTVDSGTTGGSKNFAIASTDGLGNSGSKAFSNGVTVDTTFPNVSAATIATTSSGTPVSGTDGAVAPNHTYRVYAEISDVAGVASATADVSSIESGQTAVPLVFDSTGVTIGNKTYHWISAERTVDSGTTAGSKSFAIGSTDGFGNAGSKTFSGANGVTVVTSGGTLTATVAGTSSGVLTSTANPGFVTQGGTYKVFANTTDASGEATFTANVTAIGANDQTAVPLTFSNAGVKVGNTTYHYISDELTAANPLSEGSKSLSLAATDPFGFPSSANFNATVDNTPPTISLTVPASPLSGTSNTISATVGDGSGSGVSSVRIQRSPAGQGNWTDICTDTTSPYSCNFDTTQVPDGDYDFRGIATDGVGLTQTSATITRTVNQPPKALDIDAKNNGAFTGHIDVGDQIVYTYSEPVQPSTILSGWDGSSTNVVVRGTDASGNDSFTVFDSTNTTQVKLGTVNGVDSLSGTITFGVSGAATLSTMVMSGSTVTVTFGSPSDSTKLKSDSSHSKTVTWTPNTSVLGTDGQNVLSTAATRSEVPW